MYDIIGDIHGHAAALKHLLRKLGYVSTRGIYAHAEGRQVIFLGDFIDRGPDILETLQITKAMVDAGSAQAVMGNHEFNALAYHTLHPDDDRYLRPHTIKNQKQHQATLNALTGQQLDYYLQWFKELPTHLDLPGLRIVHACWDDYQLSIIKQELSRYKGFNTALLTAAVDPASNLYTAIETVLKGPEIPLPAGCSYLDKEGNRRTRIRTKWYEPLDKQLISQYMMPPGSYPDLSLDIPLPATDLPHVSGYPTTAVPVFIGHYWMTGSNPTPLADNVACVDYSVAQDGLLAAYRWDNETMLQENKFISVPPDAR